jgi:hypothetical protein
MKTDELGKTNSATPPRSPLPLDGRSSEVNSFAAGERDRVRGAKKQRDLPPHLDPLPQWHVDWAAGLRAGGEEKK